MCIYILWYINYIYIEICDICAKPTGIKRTHFFGMRLWTFRTATLPRAPSKQHHWHHPGGTSWTNGNNPFMVNHSNPIGISWNFTIWKMFDCLKWLTLLTMMIFFVNYHDQISPEIIFDMEFSELWSKSCLQNAKCDVPYWKILLKSSLII